MDSKTFISRVAKRMGSDISTTSALTAAFGEILRDKASELDTIAIPQFGSFVAIKRSEEVKLDPLTGKMMLLPPKITVEFVAGSMLKKHLSHE